MNTPGSPQRAHRSSPNGPIWHFSRKALIDYESGGCISPLQRIPVRRRDAIVVLAIEQIASVTADGELLHIRTKDNENHTICYRLRDLAARLEPAQFIRLSRGTLVNIEMILRIVPMPGGTFTVFSKISRFAAIPKITTPRHMSRQQVLPMLCGIRGSNGTRFNKWSASANGLSLTRLKLVECALMCSRAAN